MAFSREYFARGQCVRPLCARFKECHLSSYSAEHCSNRTFCRACVPQPTLDISFLSLKSLAPKAKILDLQPPGNNTLLQLKIFASKIYLLCYPCCTFLPPVRAQSTKMPTVRGLPSSSLPSFWMPNVLQVFHDAEASNSSFSPIHLFPPNWHEAAASSCQSNKLMLSGIDCLLFAIDSPEVRDTHWGN